MLIGHFQFVYVAITHENGAVRKAINGNILHVLTTRKLTSTGNGAEVYNLLVLLSIVYTISFSH